VVFNNRLDAGLCALFMTVVLLTLLTFLFGLRTALAARRSTRATATQTPHVALDAIAR